MSESLATKPVLDAITELRDRPDELAGRLRQMLATAQQSLEDTLAGLEQRHGTAAGAPDVILASPAFPPTGPFASTAGLDQGGSAAGAYLSTGSRMGAWEPRGDASAADLAAADPDDRSDGRGARGDHREVPDPYAGARQAAAAGRRAEIERLASRIVEIQRALDDL